MNKYDLQIQNAMGISSTIAHISFGILKAAIKCINVNL